MKGIFTGGSGTSCGGRTCWSVLPGPALAHSVARASGTDLCLATQVAESVGCRGSPQSRIRAWVCCTQRQAYCAQDNCVEYLSVALGVGHGEGRAQPESKSSRELRVRNDGVDMMSPRMERRVGFQDRSPRVGDTCYGKRKCIKTLQVYNQAGLWRARSQTTHVPDDVPEL